MSVSISTSNNFAGCENMHPSFFFCLVLTARRHGYKWKIIRVWCYHILFTYRIKFNETLLYLLKIISCWQMLPCSESMANRRFATHLFFAQQNQSSIDFARRKQNASDMLPKLEWTPSSRNQPPTNAGPTVGRRQESELFTKFTADSFHCASPREGDWKDCFFQVLTFYPSSFGRTSPIRYEICS